MAESDLYWLGILLSIGSGILNFAGTVMQKKVVNEIPPENREQRFFRSLVRKPLWIWGLLCQLAFGSILFMLAQDIIGPTLPPGLMATGLIVLAIGSVKVIHESLHKTEIMGIALMIVAILFLGLSDLETPVTTGTLLDPGFLIRVTIFTAVCLGIIGFCYLTQKKAVGARGILLTIASGTFFALSNFWIAPLMGTIDRVFSGVAVPLEIVLFIIACVFLILTNIFGLSSLQTAFKYGQASNLVSLQQVPTQIAPIFYFFSVFQATPMHYYSTPFLIIAIALILVSTFFLAQRQVRLEEIKLPTDHAEKAAPPQHVVPEILVEVQLRKIIAGSTRVKQEQIREVLGLNKKEFNKKLWDWATKFGFKVDGDYINVESENIEGFVAQLNLEFAGWSQKGKNAKKT